MADDRFEQIAIALDGSPAALTAARFARHLRARHYHVIHIVEAPERDRVLAAGDDEASVAPDPALGRRLLDDVAAATAGGGCALAPVDVTLRYGDPVDELIAASEPMDLLLVTTRGRGIASRALFGSVANEVARRGIRPTLVMRPDHDLRRPERIIVALDGGARAEMGIPAGQRLAKVIGCPLVLVHVVDDRDLDATPFGVPAGNAIATQYGAPDRVGRAIERASRYLAGRERALADAGIDVQHRVILGQTIPALVEFADPADIVVVASRALSDLRLLVEPSVADHLVRQAPAPVLVVHGAGRERPAG